MKIRASPVKMSRHQARLLEQRRRLCRQQREQEWQNVRRELWAVTKPGESRVAQWWRFEDDDVETRLLEYELRPVRRDECAAGAPESVWVSSAVYDELFMADRVVEDSELEEGV